MYDINNGYRVIWIILTKNVFNLILATNPLLFGHGIFDESL